MLPELVKKLPAFYGTRNFVAMVKTAGTSTYSEPQQFSPGPHHIS
jgi:hypothetical protein